MKRHIFFLLLLLQSSIFIFAQDFKINQSDYFENYGANIIVFSDVYPEGHQGGITVVLNGNRLAACGDVRFEASQGQWQALPKLRNRIVNKSANEICVELSYPDSARHMTGFNPTIYPDFVFNYTIKVRGDRDNVVVTVETDRPVPAAFAGKLGFNLELQPSTLLGKPWIMDKQTGMFPHQSFGPTLAKESYIEHIGDFYGKNPGRYIPPKANLEYLIPDKNVYNPMVADNIISAPLAVGKKFVLNPQDNSSKLTVESLLGELKLYDGRINHNNGWFVLRSEFNEGDKGLVAKWVIRPEIDTHWQYTPVVQVSQIGYHPLQSKLAVVELDQRSAQSSEIALYQITADGRTLIKKEMPKDWGNFMRYKYLQFDFSDIAEEGLYEIEYAGVKSNTFHISNTIWDKGVWQAEIEYFLPIQMCHMRVNEKYRVWHDLCHEDDAVMAPTDFNHIDGYTQGASTLCDYKTGDHIPGMAVGGWHDAGDWDLRIESQSIQAYLLALEIENLGAYWDETSIDFANHVVEIHQPDGVNDFLQQVENGALSIVAGWNALGRLYRGVICPTVRQYTLLGDAAAHTDHKVGTADDRWVFTENNPSRELQTAAYLAAISRVLSGYNDTLSVKCIEIAKTLFDKAELPNDERAMRWINNARLHAATELYLSTGDNLYKDFVLSQQNYICDNIKQTGWYIGRFDKKVANKKFSKAIQAALPKVKEQYEAYHNQTPYHVPHDHGNRSSGSWEPQNEGFVYCMFHESYPEIFDIDYVSHCVQFFLGLHPGQNRASFIAGVGSETVKALYGANRADWSYIPGGVAPGTNLIRPDLPELLRFPFLWQQGEFCIDGHNTWFFYMAMELAKNYGQE